VRLNVGKRKPYLRYADECFSDRTVKAARRRDFLVFDLLSLIVILLFVGDAVERSGVEALGVRLSIAHPGRAR
jgi:hypothetical protein